MSYTDHSIDFSRINLMGIINTTPDSFSDGGHYLSKNAALEHARRLIDEGADILDIGGESTRPGADTVSVDEEIKRTIPLIEAIRKFSGIPISIDTSKAEVMREAASAGANMINDVWALRKEDSLTTAADLKLPVCLMHMQGSPETMQNNPSYENVILEVKHFFSERISMAEAAGIPKECIIIDPGFGFGKTLQQNIQLLNALPDFVDMGFPVLVGISRKSMLGDILQKPVDQRLYGSISAAVIAAMLGAHIIRVHDVTETRDALAIVQALKHIPQDH